MYAVSLTLLGFLPKILHDAVRGKQFVDGEVFMERDEILEGTSKNAIFAHRRFRIGLTIC